MTGLRSAWVSRGSLRSALVSVVTVTALALAGVVGTAGATASVALETEPEVDCESPAVDEAAAAAAARVCGVPVEVESARSPWNTLYALPDGKRRLDTSIAATRTDVSGEWAEIDTTLVGGSDGLEVASAVTPMVFSDGTAGQPLARITRDGHELVFDTELELTEPTVSGASVTYPQVLPGVDLVVTVNADATGFTEVLRVDSPQAAANPALSDLVFPVQTTDGLDLTAREGGFVATDDSGEVMFRSPAPLMWDSSADEPARPVTMSAGTGRRASVQPLLDATTDLPRDEERLTSPVPGDVVAEMATRVTDDELTITPDADMLTDPDTVWPVYIDPPVIASLAEYIAVSSAGWTHYNFANDDGVGRCNSTSLGCSTPLFTERLMFEFHGLGAIGNLEPEDVTSAVFSVYGTHSYSCAPAWIEAWRVGEISSATTWANSSWGVLQDAVNVAHRASCGNQQWVSFNVTEGAKAVAGANTSTLTEGVRASDESTMAGWKRYRWDAQLSITYNRAPDAPAQMSVTTLDSGQPISCGPGTAPFNVYTSTPTLRATVSDLDGGNVSAWTAVYDITGAATPVWDGQEGPWLATGAVHSRQMPPGLLQEGRVYRWFLHAWDGSRWSVDRPYCDFMLDLRPPDTATGLYTTETSSSASLGCGTPSEPTWVNTLTPTMRATLSDPDGGNVADWFYIYDASGPLVWGGNPGTWLVTGTQHSRQVPAGLLAEGKHYRWFVAGHDGTQESVVRPYCDFIVDLSAPASPTVSPVAPTGPGEASYPEGVESGGAQVLGKFRFASPSTDVAKFEYSVDWTTFDREAPASDPVGEFTPDDSGEHTLHVRAVDRAGKVSPEVTYLIDVARPGGSVWLLDEGPGATVAADSGDSKNQYPLVFAGTPTWVNGPTDLDNGKVHGAALAFDDVADVLATAGPVTEAGQSFSVSAFVRSTDEAVTATAVSGGADDAAFAIGQVQGAACPDGVGPCWAFSMPGQSGTGLVSSVSSQPIDPDAWVQLTGVFDAASGEASLYVCTAWGGMPTAETAVPVSGAQLGQGVLRVGQSRAGGTPTSPWRGEVAEVRVDGGVIGTAAMWTTCTMR